jgi:hypothetical protein
MRLFFCFILSRAFFITGFFILTIIGFAGAKNKLVYAVSTAAQLEAAFNIPADSIYIFLQSGDYHLTPKRGIDTTSISKLGVPLQVNYTYGIKVRAKFVSITGAPNFASMIFTHSGYGIFFDGCTKAVIQGVIITGGIRDSDSLATDAAIVLRNSTVDIINNIIFENLGDSAVLAKTNQGVIGICCRENSHAYITKNQIARNTWDGISLYKNATALITENVIDGVDTYDESLVVTRFYRPKTENLRLGGRGAGILLTRNAQATIKSNVIKRYKRGIGVYVNANADITNNVIEDIRQWGICVWDADSGRPVAHIEGNVIYKTGACGIGIIRYLEPKKDDPGCLISNIIVETAQDRRYDAPDKFCFQCAVAIQAAPDSFVIDKNVFYENQWLSPCSSSNDLMLPQFVDMLERRFSKIPENWFAGYSEFIQRFFFYEKPKLEKEKKEKEKKDKEDKEKKGSEEQKDKK